MKKAIILQHNGGELANQLWSFASIYAYTKETGRECRNYSFFEYSHFFNIPVGNWFMEFVFFRPFRNHSARRDSQKTQLWRKIYRLYVEIIRRLKKADIISSWNAKNDVYYLPPTPEANQELKAFEIKKTIYFDGWLFRNPTGIEKYRDDIIQYFRPQREIEKEVVKFITPIRTTYKHVIGVHIRQGDYATFKNGRYFIHQSRVREIMNEYLKQTKKKIEETCFVICSDGTIERGYFHGLNFAISEKNMAEDLFILSATDTILGSDSSFGNFAAYYGNIPHVVLKKDPIDWTYYRGKNTFFYNKQCIMMKY